MKDTIAAKLEQTFVERGMTEPGVKELQQACAVSFRTLYKYFPSRIDMIVGALEFRHQRFMSLLDAEIKDAQIGKEQLTKLFNKEAEFIEATPARGCLFSQARATHPTNEKIKVVAQRQKQELYDLIIKCSGRPDLSKSLILIYEGMIGSWAMQKEQALDNALALLDVLLEK